MVKPLPWASRLSAMPYLPGGSKHQIRLLRNLLQGVIANEGLLTTTITDGNGQDRTLGDALIPLSSTGLIQKIDRAHSAVTEEGLAWLESGDDRALLSIFHRNIRYVGEMLDALRSEPKTVSDLLQIAADEYDLPWKTSDQTRRRVTWLICLGAIEYQTATLIKLTDRGLSWLDELQLDGPPRRDLPPSEPVAVKDPPPEIADLLGALTPDALAGRNPVLGYIPRGRGETGVVEALQMLVNAATPSTTKDELFGFLATHLGISEGSFAPALTTLTKSGLIEQVSIETYEATTVGRAWLEASDALDLALLFHARYLFILEIIPLLKEHGRANELANAAANYYGLSRVDIGGIRTRLQILKAAGLIEDGTSRRYRATPLGSAVAARYPTQAPSDDPEFRRAAGVRYLRGLRRPPKISGCPGARPGVSERSN